ncbi:flavin reductase family protein [Streptomyces sp. NPDC059255]|uniref:flavin reductase family protein n=1 Tax=Streptomyces sp. NPDC059255 TaxID=3346793 RepID=UPI0036A44634
MNATASAATYDPSLAFKQGMASFPSGVTIVTTSDDDGKWWGFTASSFCSVSMDPPLVLVCLARNAECHPVFERAEHFTIHVIRPEDTELAYRFATRGADKFTDEAFEADHRGNPVLRDACVTLNCTMYARSDGGDHSILIGQVEKTALGDSLPAVYFRRGFHSLPLAG